MGLWIYWSNKTGYAIDVLLQSREVDAAIVPFLGLDDISIPFANETGMADIANASRCCASWRERFCYSQVFVSDLEQCTITLCRRGEVNSGVVSLKE